MTTYLKKMRKDVLILVVLSIVAFFLFTYRITDVPPGINGDEAAIGLNAALISKTGFDSQKRFLPLFTNTKNSPDWKQPISIYASVLVFKLFGTSYFNLRLTSIIFIILSALIIYFLIKEILNKKIALIGTILFFTTPIVMIQSHLALENIAPVLFVSLWLLMLAKYTKEQNARLLLFAGIFLGIGIFSYLGMRMIIPVLLALTIIYICFLSRGNYSNRLDHAKWFLLSIIPFVFLLFLSKFFYSGIILGQYHPYKIESYQVLMLPYLSTFDPSFLFIQGDSTPYHSTGKQGIFLLASLPLFIIGIIRIIKKTNPIMIFIVICFFLTPLFFGLGSTIHRASRLLSLVPFYILIISIGIQTIAIIKPKLLRFGVLTLILLLISVNFIDFISDYWYQYPQRVRAEFAKPIHEVYKKLAISAKNQDLKPYVDYYTFKQYPDAENFFRFIYFPQGLSDWSRDNKIPDKSIILTDINDISVKDKVEIIKVENLDYYFIINKTEDEI